MKKRQSIKKITNSGGGKQLGVIEISAYGIGNCIGSGIFVTMGSGIAFTGHSITLALVVACVVVLFAYAYKALMAGMFVLPGGAYSQAALLQPPLLTGVSAISTIFTGMEFAMFGLAIAEYASAVFPVVGEYKSLVAVIIITLFFLTTLLGGGFMGRFNSVMVAVLIFSLLVYIVSGLGKVDPAVINPFGEGYFSNGAVGFVMAIAMMSFACKGATMPVAMTADTREPKRTLPKAMLLTTLAVMIVYALIGIVSSGILPVEQVAGKSLGVVAQEIFPYGVFVVFTLGGACFAIATSLYGAIASIQHPLLATVEDGWLPAFLGKKTKSGYPWVIMLTLYVIAMVSIFVDLGLEALMSLLMIPLMLLCLIDNILMLKLVKKYPSAWENSFFHTPMWVFRIIIVLAVLSDFLICAALFTTLEAGDQYLIVILVAALFLYSWYRLKTGQVNLSDLDRAREEAEKAAQESV